MLDDVPQVRLVRKDLGGDLAFWAPLVGPTMGAKRGPVRALVDERTFHPLAALELSAVIASREPAQR
jgi:hypothetical protein